MKRKFGKQFILIPIGLALMSCTILVSQRTQVSDSLKGLFYGIPFGIMLLPFILTRFRRTSC